MRKVLIICDLFPPAFGPRIGYLVKYLKTFGWQSVVVTEDVGENTFAFLVNQCEVKAINFYKDVRFKKLRWLFVFLGELFFKYKSRKIYKAAMKLTREHSFELILCSTFRSFPLSAAQQVARETNLPLVVDIRDIIEQYCGYEFITQSLPGIPVIKDLIALAFRQHSLKERNKALRTAHHIITVSPWHVSVLRQYNPNTSLIYNGYDPELFFPVQKTTDRFIITYTGRLFSLSMRSPDLLLKAVKRLSEEGYISNSDTRIDWYVDKASKQILTEEAERYDLMKYMDFKGYIPAEDVPDVLNNSSVLLLLTNKADENGPKGIMTTKFFEFLAVEKPILCVRNDEDCLERVINETNSGLAAKEEDEVYKFIKRYYTEWKETGTTRAHVIREKAIAFSRKEQASQFIRIFEQVLEKHNG